MNEYQVCRGEVVFCNLIEPDTRYETKYCLTITVDEDSAKHLRDNGIKVSEYTNSEGKVYLQRTFKTSKKQPLTEAMCINRDNEPVSQDIPRGSKVAIKYSPWQPPDERIFKEFGCSTFIDMVCVIDRAQQKLKDPSEWLDGIGAVESNNVNIPVDDIPF